MTAVRLCALPDCGYPVLPPYKVYCCAEHGIAMMRLDRKGLVRRPEAQSRWAGDDPRADRQKPPPRTFRLTLDATVVVHPPRPAPLRRYMDGVAKGAPTPFQDDRRAIADHGSPGPLPAVVTRTYGGGSPLAIFAGRG